MRRKEPRAEHAELGDKIKSPQARVARALVRLTILSVCDRDTFLAV